MANPEANRFWLESSTAECAAASASSRLLKVKVAAKCVKDAGGHRLPAV
jgi:hypothetical protein